MQRFRRRNRGAISLDGEFQFAGLIDKLGGNDKAVERLDHFFTKVNGGLEANLPTWAMNRAKKRHGFMISPAHRGGRRKSSAGFRTELFTSKPIGIPGNDDAGALSSWYVFSAIGLYPEIPGVAGFVVGSPVFTKATIHLENGSNIQIIGEHASLANIYVLTLKVNNRDWQSPWIPWTEVSAGGTIHFSLGDKASTWGNDPSKAPPSFDTIKP